MFQSVYSIVYTDPARTQFVEVYKCTEDSAMDHPWQGRVVSLYQLATLLLIPAMLTIGCYQAVIRVLWRSSRCGGGRCTVGRWYLYQVCRNIHLQTNCTSASSNNMQGVSTSRCHRFTQHGDRNISVR